MIIVLTFLLAVFNISGQFVECWTATSTNCIWYDNTPRTSLYRRIDLRDIRNQLLTFVSFEEIH